jgi:hypothetical protein
MRIDSWRNTVVYQRLTHCACTHFSVLLEKMSLDRKRNPSTHPLPSFQKIVDASTA